MAGFKGLRLLAMAAGGVGGLSGAAYALVSTQSRQARSVIGKPRDSPFNADGVYTVDGRGPVALASSAELTLAVLGDSSAAGLGAEAPALLPGAQLATGLARAVGRPVRLITHAVSGSRTVDLADQVDAALTEPPALAVIMVGGNDVTSRTRIDRSAALLAAQVRRLTSAGTRVVVGTCPDLGVIRPIPQPLRAVVARWSRGLARAQRRELGRTGATVVPFAELLAAEFHRRPDELFSADRFHPNGAGYALAADVILAPLCAAARLCQGRG